MNTRDKIVTFEEAAAMDGARVIGTFDPLLASHAERLRSFTRRPLIAFVADESPGLMPTRARMELVAALAVVDFVAPYNNQILEGAVDDRQLHLGWTSAFVEHVRRRNE